jgi:hypothetical protein
MRAAHTPISTVTSPVVHHSSSHYRVLIAASPSTPEHTLLGQLRPPSPKHKALPHKDATRHTQPRHSTSTSVRLSSPTSSPSDPNTLHESGGPHHGYPSGMLRSNPFGPPESPVHLGTSCSLPADAVPHTGGRTRRVMSTWRHASAAACLCPPPESRLGGRAAFLPCLSTCLRQTGA